MTKIEIPIQMLTTVDTLKIELPYYCCDGFTYWAILEEKKTISVNDWVRIQQANVWLLNEIPVLATQPDVKQITREEFLEVYNRVINRLNEVI